MYKLGIHCLDPRGPQNEGELIQLNAKVSGFPSSDTRATWRINFTPEDNKKDYLVHRGTLAPDLSVIYIPYPVKAGRNRLEITIESEGQEEPLTAHWEFEASSVG